MYENSPWSENFFLSLNLVKTLFIFKFFFPDDKKKFIKIFWVMAKVVNKRKNNLDVFEILKIAKGLPLIWRFFWVIIVKI